MQPSQAGQPVVRKYEVATEAEKNHPAAIHKSFNVADSHGYLDCALQLLIATACSCPNLLSRARREVEEVLGLVVQKWGWRTDRLSGASPTALVAERPLEVAETTKLN